MNLPSTFELIDHQIDKHIKNTEDNLKKELSVLRLNAILSTLKSNGYRSLSDLDRKSLTLKIEKSFKLINYFEILKQTIDRSVSVSNTGSAEYYLRELSRDNTYFFLTPEQRQFLIKRIKNFLLLV
jgi:hypothetical protein